MYKEFLKMQPKISRKERIISLKRRKISKKPVWNFTDILLKKDVELFKPLLITIVERKKFDAPSLRLYD